MPARHGTALAAQAAQLAEREQSWFGRNVRKLRFEHSLTLDDLSRRSGLSKATLSRIENSKISPTYDAIVKIAAALDMETQDLFGSNTREKPRGGRSITYKGGERIVETPHYRLSLLCSEIVSKSFMMFAAEIKARSIDDFEALVPHDGEEQVYVVSGAIEVHTELYEPVRLGVGESMFFDSSLGHAIISTSKKNANVIWTCSSQLPIHDRQDKPAGDRATILPYPPRQQT